ncbi:MAG TPA: hypothetical protein VGM51_08305 [Armatimonadota bacterium]
MNDARKCLLACVSIAACVCGRSGATTKGLNQIVTPDIQPVGILSLSFQAQHEAIGNALQFQTEYGVTPRFEVAFFEGMKPGLQTAAAEYGLINHGPYLLSTGFTGWSSDGSAPQPFLEGGYYVGAHKAIAGLLRNGAHSQAVLGYAYQSNPVLQWQVDYQSGEGNSSTAGFTYNLTPSLSFNPALYRTNDSPHHTFGYAVLTWNVKLG